MKNFLLILLAIGSLSSLCAQENTEPKLTKKEKEAIAQQEAAQKAETDVGLVVEMGTSASADGYGVFGNFSGSHLALDNNEVQSKSGNVWNSLFLNYWGGDTWISYGNGASTNTYIGTSGGNNGLMNAYNTLYVDGVDDAVGIGVSNPTVGYKLDVAGDIILDQEIFVQGNDASDARFRMSNGGGSHFLFDDDSNGHAFKMESANQLAFNTAGANERMRIDASGRGAFGTTIRSGTQFFVESSDYSFALYGSNLLATAGVAYGVRGNANGSGTGNRYGVYGSATDGSGSNRYGVYGIASASGWAGYFDGKQYADQIAINNTSPDNEEFHMLHPAGFGSHGLRIENSTGPDRGDWTIYADASTNQHLYFLPDNTSSPDAHIEHGTGNWVPTSDARMKKNIESVGTLMPAIMKLKPTKYHMLEQKDNDTKTFGLLAQDLLEVFPGVVNYIEEADQYGVSYTELIPIMISGMQEQQQEIKALKAELEKYKELEERIAALENK